MASSLIAAVNRIAPSSCLLPLPLDRPPRPFCSASAFSSSLDQRVDYERPERRRWNALRDAVDGKYRLFCRAVSDLTSFRQRRRPSSDRTHRRFIKF